MVVGIDLDGQIDVLDLCAFEHESAKFWLGVLTEIKARGVQDVLAFSTDNLKGFSEAIAASFVQSAILTNEFTQIC